MTAHPTPPAVQSFADGTGALPAVVSAFLLLDVVAKVVALAYGAAEPGVPGVLPAVQSLLVVAAAATAMTGRTRSAIVLAVVVATLALAADPCGGEIWLVFITGVVAAVRGSRRQLGLVLLGQVTYACCFGWLEGRRHPGAGWPSLLVVLVLAAVALAVGLLTRRLVRARDRRRFRVAQLERERTGIRAAERARLADELQLVATLGLTTIEAELAAAADQRFDLASLQHSLDEVDRHSRSLLQQLRTLLDVLRGDDPPSRTARPSPALPDRISPLDVRQLRLGAAAVLGALAAHAALTVWSTPTDVGARVRLVALVGCGTALWWPRIGAAVAGAGLVVSITSGDPNAWDALASALLCLLGAVRRGPRRVWLVLLALAGYAGLLALTDPSGTAEHLVLSGYLGFVAVAAGLAARHFTRARAQSADQLGGLLRERDRVRVEERTAAARELHDLVAHQLSVTTMLVMATSASEDRGTLATTLDRIRCGTGAARSELTTLLATMRVPDGEPEAAQPWVSPVTTGRALARQLSDHGYDPVLDLDPAADSLDLTTQRTLSRIMQEAATNILRYAPARSRCHYALTTDAVGTQLSISSALPDHETRSDLSLGWGLRGARERVELTRGTFRAGPERDRWVLAVRLPAPAREPVGATRASS